MSPLLFVYDLRDKVPFIPPDKFALRFLWAWNPMSENVYYSSYKDTIIQFCYQYNPSIPLSSDLTGKFKNSTKGSAKRWKANFRCAMNSLLDVKEEKLRSKTKGAHAYKVYRLLPTKVRKGNGRRKVSWDERIGGKKSLLCYFCLEYSNE